MTTDLRLIPARRHVPDDGYQRFDFRKYYRSIDAGNCAPGFDRLTTAVTNADGGELFFAPDEYHYQPSFTVPYGGSSGALEGHAELSLQAVAGPVVLNAPGAHFVDDGVYVLDPLHPENAPYWSASSFAEFIDCGRVRADLGLCSGQIRNQNLAGAYWLTFLGTTHDIDVRAQMVGGATAVRLARTTNQLARSLGGTLDGSCARPRLDIVASDLEYGIAQGFAGDGIRATIDATRLGRDVIAYGFADGAFTIRSRNAHHNVIFCNYLGFGINGLRVAFTLIDPPDHAGSSPLVLRATDDYNAVTNPNPAAIFRNIRFDVNIDAGINGGSFENGYSDLLTLMKSNGTDGTPSSLGWGFLLDGFELTGNLRASRYGANLGLLMKQIGAFAYPDVIRNVVLRDLVLSGLSGAELQLAGVVEGDVIVDNVQSDVPLTIAVGSKGRIVYRNTRFPGFGPGIGAADRWIARSSTGLAERSLTVDTTETQLTGGVPAGGGVTLAGNEPTDASRAAHTVSDGRASTDHTLGIYHATTNIITNSSGKTNTTNVLVSGGSLAAGAAVATSATPVVSATSFLLTLNGTNLSGMGWNFGTLAAGTRLALTVWIVGGDGVHSVHLLADTPLGNVASANIVPAVSGTPTTITLDVTATGAANARLYLRTNGLTGTYNVEWQAEVITAGAAFSPSPLVPTDTIAVARAAGRFQGPATIFSAKQGWVAIKLRANWAYGTPPAGGAAYLLSYAADASNRYLFYKSGGAFSMVKTCPSLPAGMGGAAKSWSAAAGSQPWTNAAETPLFVGAWERKQVRVAVNAGAFASTATDDLSPDIAPSVLPDFGSNGAGLTIDGDLYWVACGAGTLVDADVTALNALGVTPPTWSQLAALNGGLAHPTWRWSGADAAHALAAPALLVTNGARVGGLGVGADPTLAGMITLAGGPVFGAYAGTPEGNVVSAIGGLVTNTTNGAVYRKTSGTGATGWTTP